MTEHVEEPGRRHDAPDRGHWEAGTIPVLRLDSARRADGTFDDAFLAELRAALHEIGFLQLTGYGAAPGQLRALTAAAARFVDVLCHDSPLTAQLPVPGKAHFPGRAPRTGAPR